MMKIHFSRLAIGHDSIEVVIVLGAQALELLGRWFSLVEEELDLGRIRLGSIALWLLLCFLSFFGGIFLLVLICFLVLQSRQV